jgi:hypothetical protein
MDWQKVCADSEDKVGCPGSTVINEGISLLLHVVSRGDSSNNVGSGDEELENEGQRRYA